MPAPQKFCKKIDNNPLLRGARRTEQPIPPSGREDKLPFFERLVMTKGLFPLTEFFLPLPPDKLGFTSFPGCVF